MTTRAPTKKAAKKQPSAAETLLLLMRIEATCNEKDAHATPTKSQLVMTVVLASGVSIVIARTFGSRMALRGLTAELQFHVQISLWRSKATARSCQLVHVLPWSAPRFATSVK